MPERRQVLLMATLAIVAVLGAFFLYKPQVRKMQEITFDLGKNIVETARESGVPEFQTRDVAGLVSYSIAGIPKELPVRYIRPGYEIAWQPVFGLRMYADRAVDPGLHVATVTLSLNQEMASHEAAQAFVERTIAQFAKGKWQRYFDPESELLLTGRSSLLDETGQIDDVPMTIDPAYRIAPAEWPAVVAKGPIWRWVGDGVVASLTVNNFPGVDGKPAYDMDLEFQLLASKRRIDAENLARRLKEGDAKGWHSTAKHEAEKKERAALNKRLEANALARGDSVVSRP